MSAKQERELAAHCEDILRRGSRSFAWASRLLPRDQRQRAAALYAFCREADDAIDESHEPIVAHEALTRRLGHVASHPNASAHDNLTDVALAQLLAFLPELVRPLEALLEGFLWDAQERTYESFDDTLAYCARVAASVGVAMSILLGRDEAWVLARAADLGTAMQLTNIARDVGEDARRGRVYLPEAWLSDAGLSAQELRDSPSFTPPLGAVVARLLRHAEPLYERANFGIVALPPRVRPAVRAAAMIYRSIGHSIAELGFDSVSQRAVVPFGRKSWAIALALVGAQPPKAASTTTTQRIDLRNALDPHAPPLAANAYLIANSAKNPN